MLHAAFLSTMRTSALCIFIITAAFYLNFVIGVMGVPQAMTEFVADKFGYQAAGLTYDRIASLLSEHAVNDEMGRRFVSILEECDCARFAPAEGGAGARDQLLERARQAVADLEGAL